MLNIARCYCGSDFEQKRSNHLYCSKRCRRKNEARKRYPWSDRTTEQVAKYNKRKRRVYAEKVGRPVREYIHWSALKETT